MVEDLVEGSTPHVVLAGDFDATPDAASMRFWRGRQSLGGMSVCYRDAWHDAHPQEPGHTFTPDNPMVAEGSWPLERGRRIDYVLVRCGDHGPTLEITGCERIFDEPVGVSPNQDPRSCGDANGAYAQEPMTGVLDTVRHALRGVRLRLKRLAFARSGRDRWQQPDRVIAALAVREGDRVADLGAGPGYFTFRLAGRVGPQGQVYAVDTDSDMSSMIADTAARDDVRNVVVVEAAPDDPMLPEPVDLVLMVNAFHHLPERATYLTTLSRYLRPDGRIAIIETLPRWFTFGHATMPAAIAAAMSGAGYTLAARHDFLSPQSFQIFERTT